MSDPVREARIFTKYILGCEASARAIELYAMASVQVVNDFDAADHRIVRFALARPWSLAALDGALALTRPAALLRRKLLLAAAILEARPEYADAFLPRQRSRRDAAGIAFATLRAAAAACVGFVLLLILR
jgi:hypothetical protein